MSQPLTDFVGRELYLDTMIPYTLLRGVDLAAQTLFEQIQRGRFQAYTSVLTFDELAYRLLLASIREQYSGSPLEYLRDNERKAIAEFYPPIAARLEQLQSFPNLSLVDLRASDVAGMNEYALQYQLRPRDALHLVAMQKCECFNLVSQDSDFDRVPIVHRYTLAM
jgi:predicted nucleic acid-binding protein